MKTLGWLMALASAAIIFYNVVVLAKDNEREMEEHPFITMLSLGSNLKPRYTFRPPLTEFELVVYAVGFIGVGLIVFGENKG